MKIVLKRPWQIMDMGRLYTIRTESAELATISAGQEIEVDVPSDAVEVFATAVSFFSSNRVAMEGLADHSRLEVRNRCAGWKLLIPVLPIYYLAVAKHRYLNLSVK